MGGLDADSRGWHLGEGGLEHNEGIKDSALIDHDVTSGDPKSFEYGTWDDDEVLARLTLVAQR